MQQWTVVCHLLFITACGTFSALWILQSSSFPCCVPPPLLSQPQDLIGMIDDHYNFLDHLEEMEESSSNEDDKSSIFGINFAHKTKRSRSLLSLENDTSDVYVVAGNCVHCIVVYCRRMNLVVRCIVHVWYVQVWYTVYCMCRVN